MSNKPDTFNDFPPTIATPFGPYRAIVEEVIDGDTIAVSISVGFSIYIYKHIRIKGINAPELTSQDPILHERAKAAKQFLINRLPYSTPCKIDTEKDQKFSFERYVADVILKDGTNLGNELVDMGLVDRVM